MMPDNNIEQVSSQPTDVSSTSQANDSKKSISTKSIVVFIIVSVTMLILGVSAAAYTALVVNSPERIWDQALRNTSDGINELSQKLQEKPIKGGSVEGSFTSVAPLPLTAVMSGKWYEGKGIFIGDIDIAGVQATGEVRVIGSDSSEKSEVYIKVDGLEGTEPVLSLIEPELASVISTVNGAWYKIDETMVPDSTQDNSPNKSLPPEELSNISEKLSVTIKDRLFNTDESKAVFIVSDPVGREDFEGVDTYKYNVIVQKQQFLDFLAEAQRALEGTQLQDVFIRNMTGTGTDGTNSLDELIMSIKDADFTMMRAEAWVDMGMKYFHNVRFILPDSSMGGAGYIDLGLDYEGGDELPFKMHIVTESNVDGKDSIDLLLQASFNKETSVSKLSFKLSGTTDSQQIAASGELLIAPSDEVVEVEIPANAKNISELLDVLLKANSFGFAPDEFDAIDLDSYRLDDVEL